MGLNERQRVDIQRESAGTFTLSLNEAGKTFTTSAIAFGADAQTVAAALNRALGAAGSVTVTLSAKDQYTLQFGGALAGKNLSPLTVVTTVDKALVVQTGTERQGQRGQGPSFNIDLQAPAGTTDFHLQVELNGVNYVVQDLAVTSSAAELRTRLLAAQSEDGQSLQATDLPITVKAGAADGQWTVSFGITADGISASALRFALAPVDEEAPAEPAAEVPAEPVKGAMAVGGLVVRNDVRALAQAFIRYATLSAGSVSVSVSESASIEASLDAVQRPVAAQAKAWPLAVRLPPT